MRRLKIIAVSFLFISNFIYAGPKIEGELTALIGKRIFQSPLNEWLEKNSYKTATEQLQTDGPVLFLKHYTNGYALMFDINMVLNSITLYGQGGTYNKFNGRLPFNLKFGMNRDSLYRIIDLRLNEVENNPYILTRIHNGHKIELVFSSKGLKVVNILAADSLPKANDIGFVRLVSNGKIESGDCDSLIGKMSWSDGLGTYEGEWENNLPHGKGYFKDQNNNWYKGEFKYGYLWGKGQMLVNGYYLYEGDFVMSRRQGTGNCKFYSPKNESYEGHWKEDNMDGMGKYSKGPKHYYYGNLVKNKFSGTGKLTTPEGWMEGNFTDGLPNGYIKQYLSKDDAFIEGNWVRGKREGKFQVTNSTKQISFKTFSNDVELIDR